jgi:hypothetical protein
MTLKALRIQPIKSKRAYYINNEFYVKEKGEFLIVDYSKYIPTSTIKLYSKSTNTLYKEWTEKSIDKHKLNYRILKDWALLKHYQPIKGYIKNNKFYLTWKES